ncbi:MAG: hypothetical protein V4787_02195 [Pseudomonadota bacterium]
MATTSKHSPHVDLIIGELAKGASYVSIAEALKAVGVTTTPTEIYRWVHRRASLLSSRARLINPLAILDAQVAQARVPVPARKSNRVAAVTLPEAPARTLRHTRDGAGAVDEAHFLSELTDQVSRRPVRQWRQS